jgi:uncharacterized protein YecE (DUF72 family)
MAGRIYVGIGGWVFEPWRGSFYPKGLAQAKELRYASENLTSIEINGTYYGSQKPTSFMKWDGETPDGFVFSLKGPRFATNRKVLAESGPSVEKFIDSGLHHLGDKLGPINWQFMGTKKFDPEDFGAFLNLLPKSVEDVALKHAVEVRHESFACEEFVDLARRHGVAVIFAEHEKYPQIADLTADFVYARLQTTSEDHESGYSEVELDKWAEIARQWASGDAPDGLDYASDPEAGKQGQRDVYLYFIAGHKVANPRAAMALIDRLGG